MTRRLKQRELFFLLLLILCCGFSVHAGELKLKVSGGLSYLQLGSINRNLQDWILFHRAFAEAEPDWTLLEENVSTFHSAFDFSAEFLTYFSSRLAVGAGAGFLYGELNEEKTQVINEQIGKSVYLNIRPNKASGLLLTGSAYYFQPIGRKIQIYLCGGGGLIWAKFVSRESSKKLEDLRFRNYVTQKASAKSPVFFGSLGTAFRIDTAIEFVIEGSIRKAVAKDFFGTNDDGDSGTLYYYEQYLPAYDIWQSNTRILTDLPSGQNYRNIEEAEIDFSGFSVKAGLLIKF